jgi:hypothetical protein
MTQHLLAFVGLMMGLHGQAAPPPAAPAAGAQPQGAPARAALPRTGLPFETDAWATPANAVDAVVLAALKPRAAAFLKPCSDETFVRRVYLDVIGTLPEPQEVLAFLNDKRPDKRAVLIDALMARDEFADFWSMKWCNLLRVKAEFPINLWPNAVQAYHHWLHDAVRDDKPYDQFARELLTSSGSNFRVAPVNFYRALQGRDPASIAKVVALTFMGVRTDAWPAAKRAELAVFFSRVAYKKTDEWKEEIVYLNPAPGAGPLKVVFPDGTATTIQPDQDPREVFADWLITAKNPWFARNIVNRMWSWLMGRGVIHEPDDIRADNPPACPELLALLEKELVSAHYDLRRIYKLILNSRTYQQSPVPPGQREDTKVQFARYQVRRLEAEVLIDALDWIAGKGEEYWSPIPEPFTFIPESNRTIALADGSITSEFLEVFGRPPRDTGLESERNSQSSDAQRLYLLSSADTLHKIERSPRLMKLITGARGDRSAMVRSIYLMILSRYPTAAEQAAAEAYCKAPGVGVLQAGHDLTWALINSKEFHYRH